MNLFAEEQKKKESLRAIKVQRLPNVTQDTFCYLQYNINALLFFIYSFFFFFFAFVFDLRTDRAFALSFSSVKIGVGVVGTAP